jgi:acetyl esterase/lipase
MLFQVQLPELHSLVLPQAAMSLASLCTSSTFTPPSLFGAETLSINASLVTGYSTYVRDTYWHNHPSTVVTNATFCNVTVSYTHPGQGDYINVNIWLPPADDWNPRLMAVGGGGWVAGGTQFFLNKTAMSWAVGTGYATMT